MYKVVVAGFDAIGCVHKVQPYNRKAAEVELAVADCAGPKGEV